MPAQVGEAPQTRDRPTCLSGFVFGLLPNAVIFLALYSTSWVDNHVADWLEVGVLYAGPFLVAFFGILFMRRRYTRRLGLGLLIAATATVATWFMLSALATAMMNGENTPGG